MASSPSLAVAVVVLLLLALFAAAAADDASCHHDLQLVVKHIHYNMLNAELNLDGNASIAGEDKELDRWEERC